MRVTKEDGKVTEYRTPRFTNEVSQADLRRMDCMDCHNRPAHQFKTPNDALDQALATGKQIRPRAARFA